MPSLGPESDRVADVARATLNQTGFTGGLTAGADVPLSWLTIGGAFDVNGTTGGATRHTQFDTPFGDMFPIEQNVRSNFELTARGRIGFVVPVSENISIMPYGMAGFAGAQIQTSDAIIFPGSHNFGSKSQFRLGWTAGGGVELFTSLPFSIQVQFLHMDFGKISILAPNSEFQDTSIATNHRKTEERATIGIVFSLGELGSSFGGQ
jgi:opacity protein-like surface antigen